MVKKKFTEVIEACENMSHCYEDYLALGRNICANLYFGDYIYFTYGFQPKHDYENYFHGMIQGNTYYTTLMFPIMIFRAKH